MKNRLSTLLVVLLIFCMVTCKDCNGGKSTDPAIEGSWKVVSVSSSLGASTVQPKFGQAVGGTFEINATTYTLKTPAPASAVTPNGSGTNVNAKGASAAEGTIVLDGKVTLTYSNLTPTSVTLSGNVTAGTGKTAPNDHTITLTR